MPMVRLLKIQNIKLKPNIRGVFNFRVYIESVISVSVTSTPMLAILYLFTVIYSTGFLTMVDITKSVVLFLELCIGTK